MQSFEVSQLFEAEPDAVFAVISDHAGYASLPGVRRAWLRRAGDDHRDGVNAERVLVLGPVRIVERITEYEPGMRLGYRIIESPLPIEHHGARLRLEPIDGSRRTRVYWRSSLSATTPVARRAVEFAIARQLALGFRAALAIWARRLR